MAHAPSLFRAGVIRIFDFVILSGICIHRAMGVKRRGQRRQTTF